ncbi:hypothetical protein H0Z60_12760 [Ectothiorhodospiraceae bacterium WFHF3C12]|nr:hypothetical protein [Ectothiorhodospiraceae bacterium WFHF3C12]
MERFHGRVRQERLNAHRFFSLADARRKSRSGGASIMRSAPLGPEVGDSHRIRPTTGVFGGQSTRQKALGFLSKGGSDDGESPSSWSPDL